MAKHIIWIWRYGRIKENKKTFFYNNIIDAQWEERAGLWLCTEFFFNMFPLTKFVQSKLKALHFLLRNKFSKLKDLIAFFWTQLDFWIFWMANQQKKNNHWNENWGISKGSTFFVAFLLKWIFLLDIFKIIFCWLLYRLWGELVVYDTQKQHMRGQRTRNWSN